MRHRGHIPTTYFLFQGDDVIKVGMVYVSIYSEQPLQNGLSYCDEITWKGRPYMEVIVVCQ